MARNSCPRCGELTRVPVLNMLFRSWNAFRCSACRGWIVITATTGAFSLVGGLLGIAAVLWIYFRFVWKFPAPSDGYAALMVLFPVVAGLAAFVACAMPFARWTLRLEPASAPAGAGRP